MAAFAKRARLNSQPGYAAQIDGGNPLAAGLVAAINPATYKPAVGQVSYTHAPVGVGINGTGSSYLRQEIPALGSAATILFIGNVFADAAPFAGVSGPGGTQLFCFQFITPSNGLRALLRTVNGGGVSTAEFVAPWNSGTGVESNDVLVAVYDGTNQLQVYGNGVNATASRNSTAADGALSGFTAASLGGLDRATDSFAAAGQRGFLLLVWNRALSASEVAEISANPWQLFAPRRIWVPVAGGGGGGNTIAVPAGALTLSGFAPTVTATANQRVDVPAGSLSLSAFAPVVTSTVRIVVPAGSLNLSALAPTVTATANNRITPPAGTLTLTAFAPTVAAGATQTISVPAGALTLTGFAPTVTATQNQNISVPNGALVLTGFAPNVSGVVQTIAVPSGTLVLAAFAPTVSNGAEEFTSSAVFYVPLRMVSGLWSTAGVSASIPADKQAWLPPIRQPIAYVDQRDGRTYCDPAWYRAFEFVFETRLGGRLGPSIPDVVSTVAATQETAAAASATIAEVAQQTQANAEALFVVREVVQGGALDGAEQIPGVDLR